MTADHRVTRKGHAYRQLRELILKGTLARGQRLVMRDLASRLGMSVVPVSDALSRLEQEGLVESEPGWGARVRRQSLEEIRGEYVVREALECQAARLCASHLSGAEKKRLSEMAHKVDSWQENGRTKAPKESGVVYDLHMKIAQLSGIPELVRELEKAHLKRLLWQNLAVTRSKGRQPGWHQMLVDAICSGDPDAAERMMREHIQFATERVLRELKRKGIR